MVKENSLLKTCIDILKTDDIKNEIKQIFSPVTDLIMFQIYPYIYFIIFLVLLIFVLILAILILLVLILRNNHLITKLIS
jgi:hypothetical protein